MDSYERGEMFGGGLFESVSQLDRERAEILSVRECTRHPLVMNWYVVTGSDRI